jgi:hypothetical protein
MRHRKRNSHGRFGLAYRWHCPCVFCEEYREAYRARYRLPDGHPAARPRLYKRRLQLKPQPSRKKPTDVWPSRA